MPGAEYLSPLAMLLKRGGGKKTSGAATPPSFKRGGRVRKGGMAKVHKGEKVIKRKASKKR